MDFDELRKAAIEDIAPYMHSGHQWMGREILRALDELSVLEEQYSHLEDLYNRLHSERDRLSGEVRQLLIALSNAKIEIEKLKPCPNCIAATALYPKCATCGADKGSCDKNREAHGVHLNRVGGE